jgi:hypothetical protein
MAMLGNKPWGAIVSFGENGINVIPPTSAQQDMAVKVQTILHRSTHTSLFHHEYLHTETKAAPHFAFF